MKTCVDCGKALADSSRSVRCEKCRDIHTKKLVKANNKRNHATWYEKPDNRERQKQKSREYYEANREKCKEYQRQYYQNKLKLRRKLKQLSSYDIEVDGKKITLYECVRIRVKAAHLPCGERWECFEPERCPLVPKDKEEITFKDAVLSVRIRP